MKSSKFIFDIENPCHENWDKMTANEAGKFCDSCAKTVIDFTKLSDSQIIKIIQKSSQNVCGRMREDQLHREMYQTTEKSPKSFLYKILASFLLFFGTIKTYANKLPKTQTEIRNYYQNIVEENPTTNDTIKGKTLRGKIVDEKKTPLENVKFKLKYSNIETKTDSLGKFELFIPDSLMSISLCFEMTDKYDTNNHFIYKNDFLKYNTIEFKSKNKYPKKDGTVYYIAGNISGERVIGTTKLPKTKKLEFQQNEYKFNQDRQIDTRPLKDR